VLDTIMDMRGSFEILKLDVGKTKTDESYCQMQVEGTKELFNELEILGALLPKKEVKTLVATNDKTLPDDFYGTTNHPTYVYLTGKWVGVKDLEMDCIIVIDKGKVLCKRQGLVKKGEKIVVGLDGIKVEAPQRPREPGDIFGFMGSDTLGRISESIICPFSSIISVIFIF